MITKIAKLYRASYLQNEFLGDRHYPTEAFTSELSELKQAIKNRDWTNIKEELGDSLFTGQLIAHQRTGLDFPMLVPNNVIQKRLDRVNVWKKLFQDKQSQFSNKYMENGMNFRKPKKIRAAFNMAGIKVSDDDLRRWEPIVGGYEQPI